MKSQSHFTIAAATLIFAANGYGQDSPNIQKAIDTISAGANVAAASSPFDLPFNEELQKLRGHWVVGSVERDGARNPAQVGQEVGDIIAFEHVNEQFQLG